MFTLMEVLKSMALWFTTAIMVVWIGKQLYSQTMFTLMEVLKSLAPLFTAAILVLQSPIVKDYFSPRLTMIIEGSDDLGQNQIYEAATTYVRNKISVSPKPRHFKCRKAIKGEELVFDFAGEDTIIDNFKGIKLEWKSRAKINEHNGKTDSKYFELSFDKKFECEVLGSYLPDIVNRYKRIQSDDNVVKLYTRDNGYSGSAGVDRDGDWIYVIFKNPFTFENLAMDPDQKEMLLDDLNVFLGSKDLYNKVGKTWKRGYLVYGPPGTGKSSLIAAMANYLKFNIYDLNLSGRYSDEDLRSILLSTTNRSILVIEDIDYGADLDYQSRRYDSFTLSGLLNIIDGLWSSCGEERIIVFTTNDKDKLDPALLRPGRMDVHVHMSYCTIDGFKLLATNYLQIYGDHPFYWEIEALLKNVDVTPAEIAEELLKRGGIDVVLRGVVKFLMQKEREKAKAAELKEHLKERLKSADIDFDAEGFAKFLKQKKVENAEATEAERLLNSGDTDVDVEGLVKFIKQKKFEEAKAAKAKRINPDESESDG